MILKNMREHSSALVQQAIMVSEELIRVAILWHEQWHEGLEDASRWVGYNVVGVVTVRWVWIQGGGCGYSEVGVVRLVWLP